MIVKILALWIAIICLHESVLGAVPVDKDSGSQSPADDATNGHGSDFFLEEILHDIGKVTRDLLYILHLVTNAILPCLPLPCRRLKP